MVESMRTMSKPARMSGVATARIPNGAVASELAKEGKKKTIFFDDAVLLGMSTMLLIGSLTVQEALLVRWASGKCQYFVTTRPSCPDYASSPASDGGIE